MTFAGVSHIKTAAKRRRNCANRIKVKRMKWAQFAPWFLKESRRRSRWTIWLPQAARPFGLEIRCAQGSRSKFDESGTVIDAWAARGHGVSTGSGSDRVQSSQSRFL